MKFQLILLSFFITSNLSAQFYTEKPLPPEFDIVAEGSLSFADIDGDNDQDVLVTGGNGGNGRVAKLYTNDGLANFTEVLGTPFDNVSHSSLAFVDVDGDNDQDVLITGKGGFSALIAKLYLNDGQGNFTEVLGTPFDGVWDSSLAFADVDGDNDQDVLITGRTNDSQNEFISKLYTNDGQGNFTEVLNTPFDGVWGSSLAFADVDGDNDPDVLITGSPDEWGPADRIAKLYTNDGMGNFAEVLGTPFDGVSGGTVAFADVDGDNDQDVIITGINNSTERTAKQYTNDGQGNFTLKTGTTFTGVGSGSAVAFSDFDGDNDLDVLITGTELFGMETTKLYINNGQGKFTEVFNTPFPGIFYSSIAFADVDGDSAEDVLIIGGTNADGLVTKLYLNDLVVSTEEVNSIFNFEFKPHPNPAVSNNLKVDFSLTQNGLVTVSVYDLNGQLLSQQKKFSEVGPQTISVEISDLSAGTYFIQLEDDKSKGVEKFIVP